MLAFVRAHLLQHASAERIYALAMSAELRRHCYEMSPRTALSDPARFGRARVPRSEQELANGKVRKYYRATAAGRILLEQLTNEIRELEHEVLGP